MACTEETEVTSSGGAVKGQGLARGELASWHKEEGWRGL